MNSRTVQTLDSVRIIFDHDSDPDTYLDDDPTRMGMYRDGLFYLGGIYAVAKINHIRQWPDTTAGYQYIGTSEYTSGGLWGIESDSDDNYFDEVAAEQLNELWTTLHELGYTDDQIREACDSETEFIFDQITEAA